MTATLVLRTAGDDEFLSVDDVLPFVLYEVAAASRLSRLHPELILDLARTALAPVCRWKDGERPLFDAAGIQRLRVIWMLRYRQGAPFRTIRELFRVLDEMDDGRHMRRLAQEAFAALSHGR